MEDLPWSTVRAQEHFEYHLISIPFQFMTPENARQIMMRSRVIQKAIDEDVDDIDDEVVERSKLLITTILFFPPHILSHLTEAELNERREVVGFERIATLTMDPLMVSFYQRNYCLDQWRSFCTLHNQTQQDDVQDAMFRWLCVAILKMNLHLQVNDAERAILHNVRASVIAELQEELNDPPGPLTPSIRTTLEILEAGIEAELEAEVAALGDELKTAAILSIYRPVPIHTLPLDERECTICGDAYGEVIDGKDPCFPRVSPCCPPAIVGGSCIVAWLLSNGTCPTHRGPMGPRIRAAARELRERRLEIE